MIILDTNVISEPLRPRPSLDVVSWLDRQSIDTLYLTTISLAELRYGVEALPAGSRKTDLRDALDRNIRSLFGVRLLCFDEAAASAYGVLRARARAAGQAISTADGYIAAIALAHGFAVATRDVTPFAAAGVRVIDPWA